MAILVNLDVMMARRKMSLGELSQKVDVTMANLSILKNNKAKAVRFSTLEAICRALDCQPGDILEYVPDGEDRQANKKDRVTASGHGGGFLRSILERRREYETFFVPVAHCSCGAVRPVRLRRRH